MSKRILLIYSSLLFSLLIISQDKAHFVNPVINDFTYHDSSLIQGEDGYFYSFVSCVVPRDTTIQILYYTVSIFRSRDLQNWSFYKYAFDKEFIEKKIVNDYDKKLKRIGKFPYIKKRSNYYSIWAPDIFKFKGRYYLFVSLHKSIQDSKIAVFEADSISSDFKFMNILLSSNKDDGNSYIDTEELIDPFPITIGKKSYLVYGSFRRDRVGMMIPRRAKMGVYISSLKKRKGKFVLGKRKFLTDYYEGCLVVPHGGKYWFFGTNGNLTNSTYKIDYAVADKITGPYLNKQGKEISDTINYNPGTPLLKTTAKQRFNGFGCPSKPIIDLSGQYWMMMHGHAPEFKPISVDRSEEERYTFLVPLYWNKEGEPYFDIDELERNRIKKPKF